MKEDEGFLVPVKHMWVVDKLRADLEHAEMALERAEAEKEHLAKENDKEIAALENRFGLD